MSSDTNVEITQADIETAHEQANKGYQSQWDYEMDLRQAFARHRTTSLAAQDGLVDRVAEALLSAFLAGRGSITARERRAYKPEPDMSHFRAIALASIEVKS